MKVDYDNLSRLKKIDTPILVIHSKRDNIIPYWMGQKLFETAKEPKKFLSLSSSDHAIISEEDSKTFWEAITDFVEEGKKEGSSER